MHMVNIAQRERELQKHMVQISDHSPSSIHIDLEDIDVSSAKHFNIGLLRGCLVLAIGIRINKYYYYYHEEEEEEEEL